MTIFKEVKEHITARAVAEGYGLKVKYNGTACCPFHNDHHPSMKIDKNYYCFACGAKGDAINYVAEMFGLSQYDAAVKIIEDFNLPVAVNTGDSKELALARIKWAREKKQRERIAYIKRIFYRWCNEQTDKLKECLGIVEAVKRGVRLIDGFDAGYITVINAEPRINYWLDTLCMGSEEDKRELYIKGRKEVENVEQQMYGIRDGSLGGNRRDNGYGEQHCG
jgi:DNA primase